MLNILPRWSAESTDRPLATDGLIVREAEEDEDEDEEEEDKKEKDEDSEDDGYSE